MINIQLIYNGRAYNPDDASWVNDLVKDIQITARLSELELDKLADIVVKGIRANVRAGNDIYGNALLPNMKGTTTLIDTGAMIQNLSTDSMHGIREITADMDYGIYHMTGTKNMVARPWFGFSPYVMNLIDQYVHSIGYLEAA